MPYTYQHKRNGVAISGATSASLAVTSVDSGDDGVYTLEVTNTNSGRTKVFGPKVVVVNTATLPLDFLTAPQLVGSALCASIRLRTAYTGPLARLARSSDSTQLDVGTTDRITDAEVSAFIGGGTGYFVTFYDQSGNGNHITQATSSKQPQALTGILTNLTCLRGDGTDDVLKSALGTGLTGNVDHSIFNVVRYPSTTAAYRASASIGYGSDPPASASVLGRNLDNKHWGGGDDLITPISSSAASNDVTYLQGKTHTSGTTALRVNGIELATSSNTYDMGAQEDVFAIGGYTDVGCTDAYIFAAMFFAQALAGSDLTALESRLMTEFGIS